MADITQPPQVPQSFAQQASTTATTELVHQFRQQQKVDPSIAATAIERLQQGADGQAKDIQDIKAYLSGIFAFLNALQVPNIKFGTATFATAATVAVVSGLSSVTHVYLGERANENIWWSAPSGGNFTLNSSNATSTAKIDWLAIGTP